MPIKQPLAVKNIIGNINPTLQADPGEAFLIKDIRIQNPATNWATLKTEKTTVGYFRVGGPLGNHLPFPMRRNKPSFGFSLQALTIATPEYNEVLDAAGNQTGQAFAAETDLSSPATISRMTAPENIERPGKTVLQYLAEKGLFTGYPVAEGETFIIEGVHQAGSVVQIIYEIHTPDDITPELQNGSRSKSYQFMNYGDTGATVSSATSTLYDNPVNPAEFPAFPFGKVVPAKLKASIHAIFASDVCIFGASTSNYTQTQYLKLIKDRETLFDEDRLGLLLYAPTTPAVANLTLIGEGFSNCHNLSDIDGQEPLIFQPALEYDQGDELNIYLATAIGGTGANLTTDLHQIAIWQTIARSE